MKKFWILYQLDYNIPCLDLVAWELSFLWYHITVIFQYLMKCVSTVPFEVAHAFPVHFVTVQQAGN